MRRARPRLVVLTLAALAAVAPLAAGSSAAVRPVPTYTAYDVGISVGEPSIGYDTRQRAAVYTAGTDTKRLTWDRSTPAKMTATDATAPTSQTSLDAITFTDQRTNRTFVSQLVLACSLMSFTDDAGKSYTPTEGCGPGVLLDHQTVGGGPYHAPKPPTAGLTSYPDAVYYCAQNGFSGTCARSDDGGETFGTAVPAYNTPANAGGAADGGACSAIHGHLRVGPDGTAYLPNKGCGGTPTAGNLTNSEFFGGTPALSVSEDNGQSWTVRKVGPAPAHNAEESDPSVAADAAGAVYFGWEDGLNPSETTFATTSSARIAVTTDHGKTWSTPYDVSTPLGLKNVQFPEVIAGDAGRAAFAFVGTKGVGDDQHVGFVGDWRLYVATTLDGGRSWTTVDATPKDVLQRGCISLQGTSNKNVLDDKLCDQRNLLDFNDITIDEAGRVLVAYSDGCLAACQADPKAPSDASEDKVLRQASGPLLKVAAPVAAPSRSVRPTPRPSRSPSPSGSGSGSLGSSGERLPATGGLPAAGLAVVGLGLAALLVRRLRAAQRLP